MKTPLLGRKPFRGSALLAALIVIVILTFAAAGVLSYSLNTYRNSVRQTLMDKAKEVADSEMEVLYFNWKSLLLKKVAAANVQAQLTTIPVPQGSTLSNIPFSQTFQAQGWQVTRSCKFDPIAGTSDGSAQGIMQGTLQIGRNYYFEAKTTASITKPLLGTISYHSGRHFQYSNTSLFQFAVFYQGNLEMAAGGNMTIGGPVSTNASAYLGAQANGGNPFNLTLTDSVYYFQNYNGASDPISGETDILQGTSILVDPIYNPNPQAAAPPNQAAQRALQVNKMSSQSSFLGGVDVAADIANVAYQPAYTNLSGGVDPNEVYRAVVAPPPTDSSGNLLAEDPVVAGSRMYNSAGILITINQTVAGAPVAGSYSIHVGTAANPNAYDSDPNFASIVSPDGTATSIIQNVRTPVVDPRELLDGTPSVNMTTLDVGNLNNALAAAIPTNTTLAGNYNGVVYLYDKTNNSAVGATNTLNAIRLTDGTTTPNFPDQNGNPLGFTVVSDNGVYVQGDYNQTQISVSSGSVNNPAAIMGDAITALSAGWSMSANSSLTPFSSREATPSPSTSTWNGVNAPQPGTADGMTINAAILTGNTPSTSSTNSGGAQNLVRMIEDWYYPDPLGDGTGMELKLDGSLGQLFTSKYFKGNYASGAQTGLGLISPGNYNRVYIQPKKRYFIYDLNFKTRTPAGSPATTIFSKGAFFFW